MVCVLIGWPWVVRGRGGGGNAACVRGGGRRERGRAGGGTEREARRSERERDGRRATREAEPTIKPKTHLGPERDLHGVGELVDAREHGLAAIDAEAHVLDGVVAHGLQQRGLFCFLGGGLFRSGAESERIDRSAKAAAATGPTRKGLDVLRARAREQQAVYNPACALDCGSDTALNEPARLRRPCAAASARDAHPTRRSFWRERGAKRRGREFAFRFPSLLSES